MIHVSTSLFAFALPVFIYGGPGNVISITTAYGLDGPGIESLWGGRFSASVQTGPETHSASCKMSTGSFPRE